MKVQIVAVKPGSIVDKNGVEQTLNKVSIVTQDGDVGCLYTQLAVKAGQLVILGLSVKEGRLSLKIISIA